MSGAAAVRETAAPPELPDHQGRAYSARIEAAVATMANEATTDWWTARTQAARGTTPPLQGPDVSAWRRSWALAAPPEHHELDGDVDWPRRNA